MNEEFYINNGKYFYLMHTEAELKLGNFKYGFTKRVFQRPLDSMEQHSHPLEYHMLFKLSETNNYNLFEEFDKLISIICRNNDYIKELEKLYDINLDEFRNISTYLIEENGGTEFIRKDGIPLLENIIINIFPKLGITFKKLSESELEFINNNVKRKNKNRKHEKNLEYQQKMRAITDLINEPKKMQLQIRDYQNDIKNKVIEELNKYNKCYIELATGAGKTFIVFSILSHFKPDIIICFSPRIKINEQNISRKYLNMLDNEYESFNYSDKKNDIESFLEKPGKKIITCCITSIKHIYKYIKNLKDMFIWCDEAHWGIEGAWIDVIEDNEIKKFILSDKTNISYRIFTSASPDSTKVKENANIFGNLINLKTTKDLIESGWLCPIKSYIFETNSKSEDVNYITYLFDCFEKTNRNCGFSFHNLVSHAYELFNKHYSEYKEGNTDIKPFLLINDDFAKNPNNFKDIDLDYDYKSETEFGKLGEQKHIGYVVKRYDMGYDNKLIDFIFFGDPKTSDKDIKQCIGRGTRSDQLGPEGRNKDKELIICLPVFLTNKEDKFMIIIKILRYLIHEIGIDIEEVMMKKNNNENHNYETGDQEDIYNGSNENKAIILDLLDLELFEGIKCKFQKLIIFENKKRYKYNQELIDTKRKCLEFIGNNKINDQEIYNWQKFCLGNMYEEIKNQYYNTKQDILMACKRLNITGFENYKSLYKKDQKLPPEDYINEGFYNYIPNFNLTSLLEETADYGDI
ncbi:Type III restriction enzyme, res subunit [seawater metagenome]|uniref:Type III restriction enzyme, res subunit n=1 Tax=seawater metagenome TaxID=1561972 RepID=A0A5E8CJH7_9ZZZZ